MPSTALCNPSSKILEQLMYWGCTDLIAISIANEYHAHCYSLNFLSLAVIHEPNGPTPSSQFEHSSIPATVKKLFNLNSNFLTRRDAWAGSFESYFTLRKTPRTDCPEKLPEVVKSLRPTGAKEDTALSEFQMELIQLASQLIGDHLLNSYPDIGKGMNVRQANRYAEDAVARFLEAGRAALRAGANESAIVTMRPSLTSRTGGLASS